MHLQKIEEYNFTHGLHVNSATGEYFSLYPHTLGRALTHEEMDYNLCYQKQTLNGYRIAGGNTDLTLTASDLGKTLAFTQIDANHADWTRFSAAGLLSGQFVWTPVEIVATTTTTTEAPSYDSFAPGSANVNEGGTVTFTVGTTNIPDGTTVGYTITGVSGADLNGAALVGDITISGNSGTIVLAITDDQLSEGAETISITLAGTDSNGVTAGLAAQCTINDTSVSQYTITYDPNIQPSNLSGSGFTQTAADGSTYTIAAPSFGATNGWVFKEWSPFSNGSTVQYDPGDTLTITGNVTLYAIWTQPSYTSLSASPSAVTDEGQNVTVTLAGADVPNGRTVGWTITGVDGGDISGSLTGTFTMNGDQAQYMIAINNDNLTEGTETLTFTCDAADNAGTSNGLSLDITINDTSLDPVNNYNVTYQVQPGPTYTITGQHPSSGTVADGTTFTIAGPTWSVAGYDFDGYAISSNLQAPVQYQPGDQYTVNGADVDFYARYTATPTYTVQTTFNHSAGYTNHTMQTMANQTVNQTSFILSMGNQQAGANVDQTMKLVADAGWEFDYSGLQVALGGTPIDLNNQPTGVTITQVSATEITLTRNWINIQNNGNATINITGVPMNQVFDCNYPGLVITIPAGSVGAPVNGTVTVDGQAVANLPGFSPANYQLGNQTYNVTFDIPTGFANSGQIICQASATGTTTTQPAANRLFYFFHAGQSTTPYVADMTAPGITFYTNGGNSTTTDLSVAMQDMIANSGNQYYGAVNTFTMLAPATITNNNNQSQWTYPTTSAAEPYYLAVPDNAEFPEDLLTGNHLVDLANNQPTNAASMATFTDANGNNYKLYKLAAASGTGGPQYSFV